MIKTVIESVISDLNAINFSSTIVFIMVASFVVLIVSPVIVYTVACMIGKKDELLESLGKEDKSSENNSGVDIWLGVDGKPNISISSVTPLAKFEDRVNYVNDQINKD